MMRVRCATCDKLVDKFSWWVELDGNIGHFKAECHGAKVETEINLNGLTFEQIKEIENQECVAFIPAPKIGHTP